MRFLENTMFEQCERTCICLINIRNCPALHDRWHLFLFYTSDPRSQRYYKQNHCWGLYFFHVSILSLKGVVYVCIKNTKEDPQNFNKSLAVWKLEREELAYYICILNVYPGISGENNCNRRITNKVHETMKKCKRTTTDGRTDGRWSILYYKLTRLARHRLRC